MVFSSIRYYINEDPLGIPLRSPTYDEDEVHWVPYVPTPEPSFQDPEASSEEIEEIIVEGPYKNDQAMQTEPIEEEMAETGTRKALMDSKLHSH